jgi:hypothetical protein
MSTDPGKYSRVERERRLVANGVVAAWLAEIGASGPPSL